MLSCRKTTIPAEARIKNLAITQLYKRVRDDYTDVHSGKFSNRVGVTNKMPRNEVDDNRKSTCSHGFHFCALAYLGSFGGGPIMIVEVPPEHVVSIPEDYNDQKGRCCEYTVIAELKAEKHVSGLTKAEVHTQPIIAQDTKGLFEGDALMAQKRAILSDVGNVTIRWDDAVKFACSEESLTEWAQKNHFNVDTARVSGFSLVTLLGVVGSEDDLDILERTALHVRARADIEAQAKGGPEPLFIKHLREALAGGEITTPSTFTEFLANEGLDIEVDGVQAALRSAGLDAWVESALGDGFDDDDDDEYDDDDEVEDDTDDVDDDDDDDGFDLSDDEDEED